MGLEGPIRGGHKQNTWLQFFWFDGRHFKINISFNSLVPVRAMPETLKHPKCDAANCVGRKYVQPIFAVLVVY